MANVKISNLTAATTPVAGTEVLPIVQSGATVKVSIANLTAGRAVSALSLATTSTINSITVGQGAGAVATNTALGASALAANTSGSLNTAIGSQSMLATTTGARNTAVGERSLVVNTTGAENTAIGELALYSNNGSYNVAVGRSAMEANTTASNNTAVGYQAGYAVTTGATNAFFGQGAGLSLTTGIHNTFIGRASGEDITTGNRNTIIGRYSGNQNGLDIRTASSYIVLSDGDGNPRGYFDSNGLLTVKNANNAGAIWGECTSASFTDVVLRARAARNTTNNTFSVFEYYNTGSATIKCLIADSGNITNTNGSYGTISDIKNKENIVDATPKLNKVNQLQVRNFNFKGDDLKQIGFIAQEFEQIFPSMVEEHTDKDADGNNLGTKTKTIKTSVLVPILVKAIQELKAEVDSLKAQINGASA